MSADEIVRHIKYIIADSNLEDEPNKSFLIICSDYLATFDIVGLIKSKKAKLPRSVLLLQPS